MENLPLKFWRRAVFSLQKSSLLGNLTAFLGAKFNINTNGIGLTAYFTAVVWAKLQVPGAARFVTRRGKWLYWLATWGGRWLGLSGPYSVPSLFLIARHLGINVLLSQQQPAQVVELAAGLSPRGYEWSHNHQGVYVEVDQAGVIAAKSRFLNRNQEASWLNSGKHILVVGDLMQVDLVRLLAPLLDPHAQTLIISEGLTAYLDKKSLGQLLASIHSLNVWLDNSTVLLDMYLRLDYRQHGFVAWTMTLPRWFSRLLGAGWKMFLSNRQEMQAFVEAAGFQVCQIWSAQELAQLANVAEPGVNLLYLLEMRPLPD